MTEDGRRKTEDRRRKWDDRRPKTEDRGGKSDDRRRKWDDRRPKTGDGRLKTGVGCQMTEDGRRETEDGSGMSDALITSTSSGTEAKHRRGKIEMGGRISCLEFRTCLGFQVFYRCLDQSSMANWKRHFLQMGNFVAEALQVFSSDHFVKFTDK